MFNCARRSTKGWSILNILLDFMGGILSMVQQLVTCWRAGNWAAITSNPVKLGGRQGSRAPTGLAKGSF
jgi:cystinosin